MPVFQRNISPPILTGLVCTNLEQLLSYLHKHGYPVSYCFADLSKGAWQANQVACEWASQLQLELSPINRSTTGGAMAASGKMLSFSQLVSTGIDAEAQGQPAFQKSLCLARQLLAQVEMPPQTFVAILGCDNWLLADENGIFLNLFCQLIATTSHKLIVVAVTETSYTNLRINWAHCTNEHTPIANVPSLPLPVSLVPGIGNPAIAINPSGCYQLQGNCWLIPFGYKQPTPNPKLDFDKLTQPAYPDWIRAYGQYWGNTYFADVDFLTSFAWQQFAKGSLSICLRYLEKAFRICRQPAKQAAIATQVQGIRIACWLFADVAGQPDPAPGIPEALQQFLLLAKAWGATMVNQLDTAKRCFEQLKPIDEHLPEYAYLLNIKALYELKNGNADQSLRLEQQIARVQQQYLASDYQLAFVNAINTARLYRRNNEFSLAQQHYQRAFDTSNGLRTEGDIVYINLQKAALLTEMGQSETAYIHWLKAALCWLIMPEPETITKRTAAIIKEPANNQLPLTLTAYLLKAIQAHPRYQQARGVYSEPTPTFVGSQYLTASDLGLINQGIGVFFSSTPQTNPILDPLFDSLRTVVYKALRHYLGPSEMFHPATVIVGLYADTDIACNLPEMLTVALVERPVCFQVANQTVTLSELDYTNLITSATLQLHRGIKTVDIQPAGEAIVSFKRYRSPFQLNALQTERLQRIQNEPTAKHELQNDPVLQTLIHQKILEIEISTESCKKAGINLDLNAILSNPSLLAM
ncbi:tetratricopeptide repeat protein [Spirosoma sp.]|uniref:tetratricopeptide repeat protein n=1 Tax=Spirosoma sp. TaxID=1899569 RepID=UPI00261137C0|nr:tetratricopeptide repeat protein [Spirosoma sp.]MCX6217963.1 tetratricopeptide repeat protein [Spirosoma sp.]